VVSKNDEMMIALYGGCWWLMKKIGKIMKW